MKYLCGVLIVLVLGLAGAAGWVAMKYKLEATVVGGDYLLLTEKQAKECATGGGCAVFSEREFQQPMMSVLRTYGGRQNNGL